MKLLSLLIIACCSIATVPARSLQDEPQSRFIDRPAPAVSPEAAKQMERQLAGARAAYKANPNDADAIIWLGRRLAYPGRFKEAIEVFSEGIKKFPNDARFYRHRGHRYITLRRFDLAIKDFERAATLIKGKPDEVEPDGQPNARNIPTSTLQFNIWYHLGLVYYVAGEYQKALASYRECLKVSKNPDALVATTHWLYMTLRRLNRTNEATRLLSSIDSGLEIIENDGYYQLLLMYKGLVTEKWLLQQVAKQPAGAASHSILYGIGNWYLYNGRRDEAVAIFKRILSTDQWTSFGFIAAEADMDRLTSKRARFSIATAPSRMDRGAGGLPHPARKGCAFPTDRRQGLRRGSASPQLKGSRTERLSLSAPDAAKPRDRFSGTGFARVLTSKEPINKPRPGRRNEEL